MSRIYITKKISSSNRTRIVAVCVRDAVKNGELTMSEAVLYLYMRAHSYDFVKKKERNLFKTPITSLAEQFNLKPNSLRKRLTDMQKKGYIEPVYAIQMKDGTKSNSNESYEDIIKLKGVVKAYKVHRILDLPTEKKMVQEFISKRKADAVETE